MKKALITIILIVLISFYSVAQVSGFIRSKEFSKDIALFYSKSFLAKEILKSTEEFTMFSVTPLAAAKSGDLTTLIYNCGKLNKDGIILGFYGDYWNEYGVVFTGYAFKNLNKNDAVLFLNKIQSTIDKSGKFLGGDQDNNNISFSFKDIQVLIWKDGGYKIRLFWNDFDSTWEETAFNRTKKRFEKKM